MHSVGGCDWRTKHSQEELKSPVIRITEDGEKAGLKLHIQKTKITASIPITS